MDKILIKKSNTADTRTCDWTKVTREELLEASKQHRADVRDGMKHWLGMIHDASYDHDHTKISHIGMFHEDFKTGFKTQKWYDLHKQIERHHLAVPEGVRDDVNLIDVFEYITDCVMAGKARSGHVTDIKIEPQVLMKAFENTWKHLDSIVEVEGFENE